METTEAGIVETRVPGGWFLRVTGLNTPVILLAGLVALAVFFIYLQWQQDRETDSQSRTMYLDQHKVTQGLINTSITNQKVIIVLLDKLSVDQKSEIKEMKDEISFVLSRTQQQRESMHLEMPQGLRNKLNR